MQHSPTRVLRGVTSLILAAVLALLAAAPADAISTAQRQLVLFDETSVLLQTSGYNGCSLPAVCPVLTPEGADWRTPLLGTMKVGPFDLRAGDLVDVRLEQEFTNSNNDAYTSGWWGVTNYYNQYVKSEHWCLWIMAGTGVVRDTDSDGDPHGTWVLRQQEENWDCYIHHKQIGRSGYHLVGADASAQYFTSRVYFVSANSYTQPGSHIRIEPNNYAKLQVAVYREVLTP